MINGHLYLETEQETDGCWIAEVPSLPGVLVYGDTFDKACARAKALALRVIADRLEHGEPLCHPEPAGEGSDLPGAGYGSFSCGFRMTMDL